MTKFYLLLIVTAKNFGPVLLGMAKFDLFLMNQNLGPVLLELIKFICKFLEALLCFERCVEGSTLLDGMFWFMFLVVVFCDILPVVCLLQDL